MERIKNHIKQVASDLNVFKKFGEYIFERFLGDFVTFERKSDELTSLSLTNLKLIKENVNAHLSGKAPLQLESGQIGSVRVELPSSLARLLDESKRLIMDNVDLILHMTTDVTKDNLTSIIQELYKFQQKNGENARVSAGEGFVKKSFAFLALLRMLTKCQLIVQNLAIRIVLWPNQHESPCLLVKFSKISFDSQSTITPTNEMYDLKLEVAGFSCYLMPTRTLNPAEYHENAKSQLLFPFTYPTEKHPTCIVACESDINIELHSQTAKATRQVILNLPNVELLLDTVQLKLATKFLEKFVEWNNKRTELKTMAQLILKKHIPWQLEEILVEPRKESLRAKSPVPKSPGLKQPDGVPNAEEQQLASEIESTVNEEATKRLNSSETVLLTLNWKGLRVSLLQGRLNFDPLYRFSFQSHSKYATLQFIETLTYLPASAFVAHLGDVRLQMNGNKSQLTVGEFEVFDVNHSKKEQNSKVMGPILPPNISQTNLNNQQALQPPQALPALQPQISLEQSALFASCVDASQFYDRSMLMQGLPGLDRQHSMEKSFHDASDSLRASMLSVRQVQGEFVKWTPKPDVDVFCVTPVLQFNATNHVKGKMKCVVCHNAEFSVQPARSQEFTASFVSQNDGLAIEMTLGNIVVNVSDQNVLAFTEMLNPIRDLFGLAKKYEGCNNSVLDGMDAEGPKAPKFSYAEHLHLIRREITQGTVDFLKNLGLKVRVHNVEVIFSHFCSNVEGSVQCQACTPEAYATVSKVVARFQELNVWKPELSSLHEGVVFGLSLGSFDLMTRRMGVGKKLVAIDAGKREKCLEVRLVWNPLKVCEDLALNPLKQSTMEITSEYNFDTIKQDNYLRISLKPSGKSLEDEARSKYIKEQRANCALSLELVTAEELSVSISTVEIKTLVIELRKLAHTFQKEIMRIVEEIRYISSQLISHETRGLFHEESHPANQPPPNEGKSLGVNIQLAKATAVLEGYFALTVTGLQWHGFTTGEELRPYYFYEASCVDFALTFLGAAAEKPKVKPNIHVPEKSEVGFRPVLLEVLEPNSFRMVVTPKKVSVQVSNLLVRPLIVPSLMRSLEELKKFAEEVKDLPHRENSEMIINELDAAGPPGAPKKKREFFLILSNVLVDVFPYNVSPPHNVDYLEQRCIVSIKQLEYNGGALNLANFFVYFIDTSKGGINPIKLEPLKDKPLEWIGFSKVFACEYCSLQQLDQPAGLQQTRSFIVGPVSVSCNAELIGSILMFMMKIRKILGPYGGPIGGGKDAHPEFLSDFVVLGDGQDDDDDEEEKKDEEYEMLMNSLNMSIGNNDGDEVPEKRFEDFIILDDVIDMNNPREKYTAEKDLFERPAVEVELKSLALRFFDADTSFAGFNARNYWAKPSEKEQLPRRVAASPSSIALTLEKIFLSQGDKKAGAVERRGSGDGSILMKGGAERMTAQRVFCTIGNVKITQNNGGKVTDIVQKYFRATNNPNLDALSFLVDQDSKAKLHLYIAPTHLKLKVTVFTIAFLQEFVKLAASKQQAVKKVIFAEMAASQLRKAEQNAGPLPKSPPSSQKKETIVDDFALGDFFVDLDFIKDAEIPNSKIPFSLIPEQQSLRINFPAIKLEAADAKFEEIAAKVQQTYQSHILSHQVLRIIGNLIISKRIQRLVALPYHLLSDLVIRQQTSLSELFFIPEHS